MRKVYVGVNANFISDEKSQKGRILPTFFTWEDGKRYDIDKIIEVKNAVSLKVGGQGVRYTCLVMGKVINLFLEDGNNWFVEGK
jgi:hypothetical protein